MWRPYSSRPSLRVYLRDQLERLYRHIGHSLITSMSNKDKLYQYYHSFFNLSWPLVDAGNISKEYNIMFLRGFHHDFCTLILNSLDN